MAGKYESFKFGRGPCFFGWAVSSWLGLGSDTKCHLHTHINERVTLDQVELFHHIIDIVYLSHHRPHSPLIRIKFKWHTICTCLLSKTCSITYYLCDFYIYRNQTSTYTLTQIIYL